MTKAPDNSVCVSDRASWRAWLSEHHARFAGVWLIFNKKQSGRARLAYADAVEEALCFGWIDAKLNKLDEHRYMQWFCPRKPKSTWSKLNKSRVERLIASHLMMPAGLAAIEIAKRNGAWTSIDSAEAFEVPEALSKVLSRNKPARGHFETLAPSMRKAMLSHINSAKTEPTRDRRIAQVVGLLERGLDLRSGAARKSRE